jgi:transcriptional regulator with XRE-family HTH domain
MGRIEERMVTEASPTARQRELGTRLRSLRNGRGLTVEEVAARLLCSTTKISRLETGARRPSLRDVRDLCGLYEVDEATSAEFMKLAQDARQPAWWTGYEDLNLNPLIGLEQEAETITGYSMNWVPGLLQTEAYARGIIKIIAPKMDAHIVSQRVEARMRRQQLLERGNPPHYRVLLDEAVLHRGVGDSALMGAQLDKLLAVIRSDHALVQVIPFAAGAYAAADGYFVLLEFDDKPDLQPIIYVEGLTGNLYLQRKVDIDRYRETINYLRDRALSQPDSAKLIHKVRNNYGG